MIKTVVSVSGMMCSMCESHINDAIRNAFNVKKVTSSRSRKETVIVSDEPLDHEKLTKVIRETGYDAGEVSEESIVKRGLFHR